ncbi:hypothetical protein AJ79_09023 [Helicocarpus griseus UAMH5409]|uniref:U3 small nucleolar ribonucleoprotein protein MPP10 n=1 Tax=Helicocarpus griseus UAMH5409 TaxID=1447875 RepID=A0A2B7WN39_9EURO|nr:hypothetical protein AJ79_09023 [Helicocarpus griseus UAMH5409]
MVTEITQLLSSTPELFLKPTTSLHTEWATAAKRFLDPLASDITKTHRRRLQEKRKRKGADRPRPSNAQILHLREIHANGFTARQIWEQANRVLKASAQDTAQGLSLLRDTGEESTLSQHSPHKKSRGNHGEEDELDIDKEDEGDSEDLASDDLHSAQDGEFAEDNSDEEENGTDDEDSMSIDADQRGSRSHHEKSTSAGDVEFVADPNNLNDGFFSIDDFNAQTALFERKDAKGLQDDDEDDDDEPVDWNADPLASGQMQQDDEDEDEDEDDANDDGGGSNPELMDEDGDFDQSEMGLIGDNANDIKYADFFEPPPLKALKRKSGGSSKPRSPTPEEEVEAGIQRAISDVQRDLFDDDMSDNEEMDDSDDQGSGNRKGEPLSTHERRQAKLTDEIRRLEAANVSKKEWMLAGEAKSADRPMNSLIEEDLEFERVGKPVPVISNEISDDIESLIKRRILAKDFDEVPRRQPFIPGNEGPQKREQFTLDETKPQKSLAELYEEDHLRKTDSAFVDSKSAKLKAEHDEIAQLWNNISSQLDTLSSWHHRPKPPQASINVVTNVATISMEDVRPTGGSGVDTAGMLAPQEVYAPGDEGKARGEIVLKSGAALSKEEMSREAKLRRRRREKQKLKKNSSRPAPAGKQAEKQKVVSDLTKGGVKVIGKQGDLKDVYGNKVASNEGKGQVGFKL